MTRAAGQEGLIKALSLHQPWASLVQLGIKTIETRSWSTECRGPLAIHATKRKAKFVDMKRLVGDQLPAWDAWYNAGLVSDDGETDHMPYGAVVATCELVDCLPIDTHWSGHDCVITHGDQLDTAYLLTPPEAHSSNDITIIRLDAPEIEPDACMASDVTDQLPYGDFTPGRFAWLLADIKPVEPPVPAKGHQQLWEWAA